MRPSGPSWYFLKWMLFLRKHETATVGNFTPVKTRSRLCSLKNCATTSPSPKKIPVGSICLERFSFYLPDFWFQPSNTHWWQATQATQPPFSCIFWMLHTWFFQDEITAEERFYIGKILYGCLSSVKSFEDSGATIEHHHVLLFRNISFHVIIYCHVPQSNL